MAGIKDLQRLFQRYLDGECNAPEIAFLLDHFSIEGNESQLYELIESELAQIPPKEWEESQDVKDVFDRVQFNLMHEILRDKTPARPQRPIWYRYVSIAASVLIVLGIALYLFNTNSGIQNKIAKDQIVNDALPGRNKATLTLANGSVLNLDEAINGEIANESGILIHKTDDGTVLYETKKDLNDNAPVSYNTISTPNGGQYKIILPDGSQVWLNAASSLRYPTRFSGDERMVALTGEGYFEVEKNKSKPFIVSSEKQKVEVIGTHFNVNAYSNEASTNTTLLEGSVRIVSRSNIPRTEILKPGQQAIVSQAITIHSIDVSQAVAWKDGMFNFEDMTLKEVMRQLERWYDVKVDYTGMPDMEFVGTVPRNAKLSSVLKALEVTSNLKFKIEERRIMLMR